MSEVTAPSGGDEQGSVAAAVATETPAAIIGEIFDSAAGRPNLASLAEPLKVLWEAGEWRAERIVNTLETIDFGGNKDGKEEAS